MVQRSGGTEHPTNHVMEIFFEPSDRYNIDIPVGETVRLAGFSDADDIALNGRTARVLRFIPAGAREDAPADASAYEV